MAKTTKANTRRKSAAAPARPQAKRKTTPATKSAPSKTKSAPSKTKQDMNGSMLEDYFLHAMKDIYWAENALTKALPKMSKEATAPELKKAFDDHLVQTKKHIERLEQVFKKLGKKAEGKKCDAMQGLIEESESIVKETKDDTSTRDAALIIAAQKVEHYEIATYGGLIQLAKTMDKAEIANILVPTLNEEKTADELLTRIAEAGGINVVASLEESEAKPTLKENIMAIFTKK